ncbi:MAG TPA: YbhB/YbcL family Raf kinase inhibitor-like protein [Syntrophales bacterium]|nr:YbhB/YbcL family Raf kinase inhibitor-like protein [Syntrophales bacterium]
MKKIFGILALLTVIFVSTGLVGSGAQVKGERDMEIKSSAFKKGARIPAKYTCDGVNVSPPIVWSKLPAGTKSLALICDDPDAPVGTWVHWVIYDVPGDSKGLPEKLPPLKEVAAGGKQGMNDFRAIGYGGPCPPSGEHRYFFRLYALDAPTGLKPGATKAQLIAAMEGHILGEAELMGKFKR